MKDSQLLYGGLAVDLADPDNQQYFNTYKDKNEVAELLLHALVTNGYCKNKTKIRDDGFFSSDTFPKSGALSIAPAIITVFSTLSAMNKNSFVETAKDSSFLSKGKDLMTLVKNSIDAIITDCTERNADGDVIEGGRTVFGTTPFSSSIPWTTDKGYIDTVTWVFPAMQLFKSFMAKVRDINKNDSKALVLPDGISDTEAKADKLYMDCVRYISESIVYGKCEEGEVPKAKGWSFTKVDADRQEECEASLYFSYVASTVSLSIYKEFAKYIETFRSFESYFAEDRRCASEQNSNSFFNRYWTEDNMPRVIEYIQKQVKEYETANLDEAGEKRMNFFVKTFLPFIKSLTAKDYSAMSTLFDKINGGNWLTVSKNVRPEEKAYLTRIKQASLDASEYYWNRFKAKMAVAACYTDGTPVDDDDIIRGGHSNVLFNSLFVIGLLLNSAYDEKVRFENSREEYDYLCSTLQLAVQNVQRKYDEMDKDDTLYKVDSYVLEYIEKDPSNESYAKQLRKLNINACSLLPILLKTSSLIGDFLVRYPQKQMSESLKSIVANRKRNDKDALWVWDKEEYNVISNYYYVDAVLAFYRYYEKYEKARSKEESEERININSRVVALQNDSANEIARRDAKISELTTKADSVADKFEVYRKSFESFLNIPAILADLSNALSALPSSGAPTTEAALAEIFAKEPAVEVLLQMFNKLRILSEIQRVDDVALLPGANPNWEISSNFAVLMKDCTKTCEKIEAAKITNAIKAAMPKSDNN